MATHKLLIRGVDVTEDVGNLNEFSIFFKLDEESYTVGEQLSENLIITGDSYEGLRAELFDGCNSYDKIIRATFSSDMCGGVEFDLFVNMESVEDSPAECALKIPFKSFTTDQCCFQELDATYWYSDGFIDQYDFPMLWFCNQPSFLQAILIFVRFALGGIKLGVSFFLDLIGLSALTPLDEIDNWIHGCGRVVPVVLIRDVLEYQLNKCGLTFSSSIYQDESSVYYNEAIACFEAGEWVSKDDLDDKDKIKSVFEANAINISTIDLLEMLSVKYNAKFRIVKGVMYFEHEEFFDTLNLDYSFDLRELVDKGIYNEPPIYRYNDRDLTSGVKLEYASDIFDREGNRVLRVGFYKKAYGFNVTENSDLCKYSPNRFEAKTFAIPFSPARFMDDCNIDPKFLDRTVDKFRKGGYLNIGIKRHNDLVLSGDMTTEPKLVILERGYEENLNDVRVERSNIVQDGRECFLYQPQQMVDELYERFYQYHDPEKRRGRMIVTGVEIPCSCDLIKDLMDKSIEITFMTHYGYAKALEYELVMSETEPKIIVSEAVVYCGD